MAYEIPIAARERARSEFERALDAAVPAYELGQLGFFNEDIEGFIRKEVERKLYEPALPNAGDRERKWVERLEKLASLREWSGSARAFHAATRIKTLLPKEPWHPGKYYTRAPLTFRTSKSEYEWLKDLRDIATAEKQWDRKWFAELLLGGLPEEVSNFVIECLYLLKMPDGQIERRVRLVNILGETSGEINLDSKAFASPEKFRDWCLSKGNFAWSGNQTALHELHKDICAAAAWKVINLVVTLGWHPLAAKPQGESPVIDGVWFMGDCAYRNGTRLELNEGCYWITHKDEHGNDLPAEGYQLADEGRENPFFHKKPKLQPERKLTECKLKLAGEFETQGLPAKPTEGQMLGRFLREIYCRLKNISGDSAALIMGSMFSYAAGPEIFHEYSQFPGSWLHGSQGSGKSTIFEWMMEVWGMSLHNGIILRGNNSTPTGLLQAADQYSNLPIWLDEFRAAEVGEDKKAVIHNFFNRGGQAKFSVSKLQRSIRTNALISGESTTSDAALRSRYPHFQVAKAMRTGTPAEQMANYEWFTTHRHYFHFLGRWLLENRQLFVDGWFRWFESLKWLSSDLRVRIVHGASYAAWMAVVEMMEEHYQVVNAEDLDRLKNFTLNHTKQAAADVVSETNTNVFFTDLLAAVKADAIPADCFRLDWDECLPPGISETDENAVQTSWKRYRIYIEPNSLIAALQKELVKQRGNVVLKRKDLRDQFSKETWWLGDNLRMRFAKGTAGGVPCWGIDVDKHPLGSMPCTDAAFNEYRRNEAAGDPRKGPLFELVDWIESKQEK